MARIVAWTGGRTGEPEPDILDRAYFTGFGVGRLAKAATSQLKVLWRGVANDSPW